MVHHSRTSALSLRNLAVLFVLAITPLMASCEDAERTGAGADDYDQGVKVDKQYDEQQDKLRNCTPQSSLESAPRFVLADFKPDQSALDAAALTPILVPADQQLAWGSGGGGGGNGGKGHDRNCP